MSRLPIALLLTSVLAAPAAAQTGAPSSSSVAPPSLQTFTVDNGAAETSADTVTLRWTYTHPAGPGQPVAGVRVRSKPPQGAWAPWPAWTSGSQWNGTATMALSKQLSGAARPGVHEFEIQLRDRLDQVSATRTASITRTGAPAPGLARPTQRYQVDGRAAWRFAWDTGFKFAATVRAPLSTCTLLPWDNLIEARVAQSVNNIGATPRCRFEIFTAKKLRPGWRLIEARFNHDTDARIVTFLQRLAGTDVPYFSFETHTPYRYGLQYIVLEGPVGADWRDAFRG
jgi:hypothetical protein